MLDPTTTVKLRAAYTVEEGLRFVAPDVLRDHLFFDPQLLEMDHFWSELAHAMPVNDNMRKAFDNKNPIAFQPHLDDYCERLYNWYSDSYEPFMELLA